MLKLLELEQQHQIVVGVGELLQVLMEDHPLEDPCLDQVVHLCTIQTFIILLLNIQ